LYVTYVIPKMFKVSASLVSACTPRALIDAYHNETSLWDVNLNASEEQKQLAWARHGHALQHVCRYRTNLR